MKRLCVQDPRGLLTIEITVTNQHLVEALEREDAEDVLLLGNIGAVTALTEAGPWPLDFVAVVGKFLGRQERAILNKYRM